jgi:hypothetical protein
MADAKKCDRCGSFYEPYRGVRVKREGSYYSACCAFFSGASCGELYFDLCPSCMASTLLFMNIPKEQVNYQHEENAEGSEEE